MNEEQNQQQQQGFENHVGGEGFSRSENSSPPTTPPAGAGVSPPWGPNGGVPYRAGEPIWAEIVDLPESEPEAEELDGEQEPRASQSPLPWDDTPPVRKTRPRGTLKPAAERPLMPLTPPQKLLLLDTWQRSGLPARDFGALVNVSRHTLYSWKKRFEELGPAGLVHQPKGAKPGSKLPDLTKRTILMLKQAHPDWGCERISNMIAPPVGVMGHRSDDRDRRKHEEAR